MMRDVEEIQDLYDESERAARLGRREAAERLQERVIDCCNQLLLKYSLRPTADLTDTTGPVTTSEGGRDISGVSDDGISRVRSLLALTYNNRGYIKYLRVDFDEAVSDYSAALAHCNTLGVAYYNRGLIHYRLGRFEEAIADQERALACQPDFLSASKCLEQSQQELKKRKS